jgi:hypothetical protein
MYSPGKAPSLLTAWGCQQQQHHGTQKHTCNRQNLAFSTNKSDVVGGALPTSRLLPAHTAAALVPLTHDNFGHVEQAAAKIGTASTHVHVKTVTATTCSF